MPNRIIREDLLDSDRYASISTEAKLLFVHLLLLADDLGCVGVSEAFLRRRAFHDSPSGQKIAKLLTELVDTDLVRTYESGRSCYAFIPRFRQRLKRSTLKHPKPPESLYLDDTHAIMLFNEINEDSSNPAARGRPEGGPPAAEEKGREGKRREEKKTLASPDKESGSAIELIPLVGQKQYPVYKTYLDELERAYPAVDGPSTLREIRAWCVSNPTKCKTERGVTRFINRWFEREQNHG